jgi:hypothetical protein
METVFFKFFLAYRQKVNAFGIRIISFFSERSEDLFFKIVLDDAKIKKKKNVFFPALGTFPTRLKKKKLSAAHRVRK